MSRDAEKMFRAPKKLFLQTEKLEGLGGIQKVFPARLQVERQPPFMKI